MPQRYDVAVIGAGLGGLTAAALLARAGRKTVVLERNTSVGGAASTYKVKDLVVEGALHQTGDPRDPRDPKHAVLKRIGILDAVDWAPIPALYEVRGGPLDAPFVMPGSFAAARAALAERFPHCAAAVTDLLAAMEQLAAGAPAAEGRDAALADVFDRAFADDEAIKCALAANLACYHDDPRSLSWRFFAAAQGGCLASGPRFIRGGSQRLSNALRRAIQTAGGVFLLRRAAVEIRLDRDGRIWGLVHRRDGGDSAEIEVPVIVGNAAPAALAALLPESVREPFTAAYAGRPLSTSVFSATIGLARPPSDFGLCSYATVLLPSWLKRLEDYPRGAARVTSIPEDGPPVLTVISYAAIDSGLGGPPFPIAITGLDRVANWSGLDRRAFEAQRACVLDALIAAVDRAFPGLASSVVLKSLNTATSMSSYLNAPQGAIYGFAPVPGGPDGTAAADLTRTPVPGMFLASAYNGGGGFTGAIGGGAAAADVILADG